MEKFDVVVIGAGPGGYVAAIRAAQLGMTVGLIERRPTLGGTCLNIGCIPSKALLESSELFWEAQNEFSEHGIDLDGISLNLGQMHTRRRKVVGELTQGLPLLMKKNRISVLEGDGRLLESGRVEIRRNDKPDVVEAQHVILAMGSAPVELPFLPFDGQRVVSSTEALEFDSVPKSLVVIGAGAIGLELGSVWARLGSQVTVIELLENIAPLSDPDMSRILQRSLSAQGIQFRLGCKVEGAEVSDDAVHLRFANEKGDPEQAQCERILVAVGRRPLSESAGIREAGVELDDRGRVIVDDDFATNLEGVYAIGDLIHGPMLAHKAEDDGVALAEILAGQPGHVNYDLVPNVIYTSPELAEVGIGERLAKERAIPTRVGKFFFRANARAKSIGKQDGLVKIVAHAETDQILGVHIVGPHASDLIAEAVTAMEFSASAEDLARTVHAHPTLSEVVKEAALAVDKRTING